MLAGPILCLSGTLPSRRVHDRAVIRLPWQAWPLTRRLPYRTILTDARKAELSWLVTRVRLPFQLPVAASGDYSESNHPPTDARHHTGPLASSILSQLSPCTATLFLSVFVFPLCDLIVPFVHFIRPTFAVLFRLFHTIVLVIRFSHSFSFQQLVILRRTALHK